MGGSISHTQTTINDWSQENPSTTFIEDFFNKFEKAEMPFGDPKDVWERFELEPKTKTYGLRNIPYKEITNKLREYKNKQMMQESLNCAKMMLLMN